MAAAVQDDTRTRVLDVAMELIAEKGFAATSTREVCERIGFTKAALYYHFRAKDDLLAALTQPVLDALAELVAGEVEPAASARRGVVTRYVDFVLEHSELMRVLYDDPSVRAHAALRSVKPLYLRLYALLLGTDTPEAAGIVRARAATGAVHAALLRGEPAEDPQVPRAVALAAACAVLGVPGPRSS